MITKTLTFIKQAGAIEIVEGDTLLTKVYGAAGDELFKALEQSEKLAKGKPKKSKK